MTTARNSELQELVGAAVRGRFPIFEHTTYVNSCSQGALSTDVREAYEAYLAGWDEDRLLAFLTGFSGK